LELNISILELLIFPVKGSDEFPKKLKFDFFDIKFELFIIFKLSLTFKEEFNNIIDDELSIIRTFKFKLVLFAT
jgi:hypothetical protein